MNRGFYFVECLLCCGLFLLCWMFSLTSYGQANEQVILRGVVVDADSLSHLPFVHIREKSGRLANATDAQGQFNVRVFSRDTIVFTSVGYKPFLLVPADSTEESLLELTILMKPHVNELQEVTVKAYDDISKLIRREEVPFSMERDKPEPLFERKEPKEQKAVRMTTGANGAQLEGAVTAFANLFNDKYQQEKKLKQLLEIQEAEERQQYLREIMTEKYQEMVAQASNLSDTDIQRFTITHMPAPEAMLAMDDYTIMLTILNDLKTFEPEEERRLAIEKLLKKKVFEGEVQSNQ